MRKWNESDGSEKCEDKEVFPTLEKLCNKDRELKYLGKITIKHKQKSKLDKLKKEEKLMKLLKSLNTEMYKSNNRLVQKSKLMEVDKKELIDLALSIERKYIETLKMSDLVEHIVNSLNF